jgi:hypothetical protein
MDAGEGYVKNPVKDIAYLQELMEKGYVLEGPRQNPSKDLKVMTVLASWKQQGRDLSPTLGEILTQEWTKS